jgi:hypothetical protein
VQRNGLEPNHHRALYLHSLLHGGSGLMDDAAPLRAVRLRGTLL